MPPYYISVKLWEIVLQKIAWDTITNGQTGQRNTQKYKFY